MTDFLVHITNLEDRHALEAALLHAVTEDQRARAQAMLDRNAGEMASLEAEFGPVFIGDPMPTPKRTVADLQALGIVGIYRRFNPAAAPSDQITPENS